jgi:hypothetical protein
LLPVSPLNGGGAYDPAADYDSDGDPQYMKEHLELRSPEIN